MSNEQREEQMMALAEEYSLSVMDDFYVDSELTRAINDFCAGWRAADSHPNWIPVEMELPKENEEVLAYNAKNEEVIACDYHHKMFHCWPEAFRESITHWMPMPHPPRKED